MYCNESIFNAIKYPWSGEVWLKIVHYGETGDDAKCLWTCDQMQEFREKVDWADNFIKSGYHITHPLQYQIYHVGVICNFFLFVTLMSRTLTGTTFLFLRVVAFVQLSLGLLYYTHPLALFYITHPASDMDVEPYASEDNWFWQGRLTPWGYIVKDMVVAGKFMLNILALFLTADRFVAVCVPSVYRKINPRKYFFVALAISFTISLIEMEVPITTTYWPAYVVDPVDNKTKFQVQKDEWGLHVYSGYLAFAVIGIKFIIVTCMVLCGVAITLKLFRRGRQLSDMMGGEAAVKEYNEMLALCRFQMVDTLVMITDVLAAVLMDSQRIVGVYGENLGLLCSWSANMIAVDGYLYGWVLDILKDQFMAFEHAELFFIYMIFFKKFRLAFFDIVKIVFKKVKSCGQKLRGGGASTAITNLPSSNNVGVSGSRHK